MNRKLILPPLGFVASRSYVGVMAIWVFIGSATKHEYALLLTIARLNFKIIADYNRARAGTTKFYTDTQSLSFSSLVTFSNNIESVTTDIYRLTDILEKIIDEYKDYSELLPIEAIHIISEIKKDTYKLRNDAEHIGARVIGNKAKHDNAMGNIQFGIVDDYILISHNKLKIKKLINWIRTLNEYVRLCSQGFIEKYSQH